MIVIEPANPQVVYVPQYNPQVVYTQPTTTTVVVHEDDDDEAAAAVIGFAAGVVIGAAVNNNYYYGPYGWRGGAYMYNDGWNDWYDDREDAREDYYENREDAREDYAGPPRGHGRRALRARGGRAGAARRAVGRRAGAAQRASGGRAAAAHRAAGGARLAPRPRRSASSSAPRRRAGPRRRGAPARRRHGPRSHVGLDAARQRRAQPDERRAQRHALRRLLGLLERQLDPVRQLARQRSRSSGSGGGRSAAMSAQATTAPRDAVRDARVAVRCCVARPLAPTERRSARLRHAGGSRPRADRHRQGERPPRAWSRSSAPPDRTSSTPPTRPRAGGTARCSWRRWPRAGGWETSVPAARSWSSATRPGRSRCRSSRRAAGWSFDAAAGREEVLNRRIGRNELAVIRVLHDYVAAQRAYAATGHDGKPAGRYARRFGSDPGRQNGLYWPARRGEPRSPLGVLVARGSEQGYRRHGEGPSPFHGYYFRILEGQGKAAKGGAAEYVVDGEMTGGFALVAWPVHYDASGVMTFIVNQDGVAYEKDLGPETAAAVTGRSRATTPTRRGARCRPRNGPSR